jgi:hypothetical protein
MAALGSSTSLVLEEYMSRLEESLSQMEELVTKFAATTLDDKPSKAKIGRSRRQKMATERDSDDQADLPLISSKLALRNKGKEPAPWEWPIDEPLDPEQDMSVV